MKQEEFNTPIEIFFDEWQHDWKWIKIKLYNFQNSEEIVRDKSNYWVFNGSIESHPNPLRVSNDARCRLWFSKVLFKREIQRHLLFNTLVWSESFDITMEVKRPSKYKLLMKNVEHSLTYS